jgi:nucleoside 2-deoxyribosyltransferase
MRVVYAQKAFPDEESRGIFLAGPTYRRREVPCSDCHGSGTKGDFQQFGDGTESDCATCKGTGTRRFKSWRQSALALLGMKGFDGEIYVPEFEGWGDFVIEGVDPDEIWQKQVEWELTALARSTVVLFWVPRDMEMLPGMTTNVEFGYWIRSGKVVLGYPEEAPKMRYLHHLANSHGAPVAFSLKETIDLAVQKIGRGK